MLLFFYYFEYFFKSRRRTKKELLRIEEYEDTDVAMIQNLKDKDNSTNSLNEDNGK